MLLFLYYLQNEEQNNFSKSYLLCGLNMEPLVIHSDAYLTGIACETKILKILI